MTQMDYDRHVDARAEQILAAVRQSGRNSMWSVHAQLHKQAEATDLADQVIEAVDRTLYEIVAGGDDAKL
ncbi:MAG: hypothetical protein VX528_11740, partial [Candidatus Latescibacterota bacterium]|nr:hypothetical protein [Candidatus Latescibacterota bacterium]